MLFCNSKLSTGNCVVLDPKKSSTYCREYASGFLELAAVHVNRLFASQRRIARTGSKLGYS